jgi:hypothetical protein
MNAKYIYRCKREKKRVSAYEITLLSLVDKGIYWERFTIALLCIYFTDLMLYVGNKFKLFSLLLFFFL